MLTAVPGAALAQPLAEFLASARQNNLEGQVAVQARKRAEADLGQAWGRLLPALSASGGWTYNQYDAVVSFPTGQTTSTTVTIVPRNQLEATLKAEVPIIDASQWLLTSAAAAGAQASRRREESTWLSVSRQVVQAYYRHLAARAVLDSARRSLEAARAELQFISRRVQAGVANELDQVRAEAEVERNTQLVADADGLVETSARALKALSGRMPERVESLPQDDLHDEPLLQTFEERAASSPAVDAAQAERDQAAQTYAAATLTLVPRVNAQFTQRFTNATGFQESASLYNLGVGFSWRLDVPAAFALASQAAARSTAELTAARALQAQEDQIHADWHTVRTAITRVRAATSQLKASERASALAKERYGAGVATQVDVTQAERDRFSADVSRIQALADLAFARAALRLSSNLPLEQVSTP